MSKLAHIFDIKGQFSFKPIRSLQAVKLLKEFYDHPPYSFFIIDDINDLCFYGLKAVPIIVKNLLFGLLWPFGGRWNWLDSKRGLKSNYILNL